MPSRNRVIDRAPRPWLPDCACDAVSIRMIRLPDGQLNGPPREPRPEESAALNRMRRGGYRRETRTREAFSSRRRSSRMVVINAAKTTVRIMVVIMVLFYEIVFVFGFSQLLVRTGQADAQN